MAQNLADFTSLLWMYGICGTDKWFVQKIEAHTTTASNGRACLVPLDGPSFPSPSIPSPWFPWARFPVHTLLYSPAHDNWGATVHVLYARLTPKGREEERESSCQSLG